MVVTVHDAGERDGTEVVQCYASDFVANVACPDRQLVGFARLPDPAGERRRLCLRVHSPPGPDRQLRRQ
jgi:hypothetical protein